MLIADPEPFYDNEYGHSQSAPGTGPLSKKALLETIANLETKLSVYKEIRKDGEARLAAQVTDFARRDKEIDDLRMKMDKELQMNDKVLSDAALGVRTRDLKIFALVGQAVQMRMAMQEIQKNKHQIVENARREARQEVRAEMQAEIQQKHTALDTHRKSVGHNSSSNSSGTSKAPDVGRRAGSSYSRYSTGGGLGARPVRIGRAGK